MWVVHEFCGQSAHAADALRSMLCQIQRNVAAKAVAKQVAGFDAVLIHLRKNVKRQLAHREALWDWSSAMTQQIGDERVAGNFQLLGEKQ